MGNDQLFKKNKARYERSLRRQKAKRDPYDIILIVCEGSKTEPQYFREVIKEFKLNTANVMVCDKKHGSEPLSVVNCAAEELKKDTSVDYAYCVFDRDKHRTFNDAIQKLKNKKKLIRILSEPCFEFWLLLHYVYTTKLFCVAGEKSNCDEVIKELKKHIVQYEKGHIGIFQQTKDKLETAIKNSEAIVNNQTKTGQTNPSTEVYKLIRKLQNLKK
jgi:hypothetical protein